MKKLNEKTKTLAIAALGVVLLGVGAFQFMGHPKATKSAKPTVKAPVESTTQVTTTLLNPEYANALPPRDPFQAPPDTSATPDSAVIKRPKVNVPVLPTPNSNMRPSGLTGTFPPMNPGANGTSLPGVGLSAVKPIEPVFQYQLHGVIEGEHPAALFADPNGDQRLIALGKSLDGDSRLVSVGDHGVVVDFHGKRLHLTLGIAPSNK